MGDLHTIAEWVEDGGTGLDDWIADGLAALENRLAAEARLDEIDGRP
jgi:hypothetical protein